MEFSTCPEECPITFLAISTGWCADRGDLNLKRKISQLHTDFTKQRLLPPCESIIDRPEREPGFRPPGFLLHSPPAHEIDHCLWNTLIHGFRDGPPSSGAPKAEILHLRGRTYGLREVGFNFVQQVHQQRVIITHSPPSSFRISKRPPLAPALCDKEPSYHPFDPLQDRKTRACVNRDGNAVPAKLPFPFESTVEGEHYEGVLRLRRLLPKFQQPFERNERYLFSPEASTKLHQYKRHELLQFLLLRLIQ
eukprot:scaffold70768_cov52-Cyclotella_meneghiniana.AAC.1